MAENRVPLVVLLLLLGLAAVLFVRREPGAAAASSSSKASVPAAVVLPPLVSEGLRELSPGHVLSAPAGAREPRPIALVLHTDADPRARCAAWRSLAKPEPFVLCLRAQEMLSETERELRAALAELKGAFGPYVAKAPTVLAGFDGAAAQAATLARKSPSFFSRLVLVDGGHQVWSASAAGAFKERGGQRIVFGCTTSSCRDDAQPKLTITRSLDLPSELVYAPPPAFDQALSERYSWLLSDVPKPKRVPNPREGLGRKP